MSHSPSPPSSASSLPDVHHLHFWRRFHVRMSGLFGGLVLFLLLLMGIAFYQVGVRHQVRALQSRLRTAAVTLSHQIRPEAVRALNVPADRDKPEYYELVTLFEGVAADEPQFVSIYVLRATDRENILAFAADYVAPGRTSAAPSAAPSRCKRAWRRPIANGRNSKPSTGTGKAAPICGCVSASIPVR